MVRTLIQGGHQTGDAVADTGVKTGHRSGQDTDTATGRVNGISGTDEDMACACTAVPESVIVSALLPSAFCLVAYYHIVPRVLYERLPTCGLPTTAVLPAGTCASLPGPLTVISTALSLRRVLCRFSN